MLVEQVACHPLQQQYPMFHVDPGRHSDAELCFDDDASEKLVRMSVTNRKHKSSTDEFMLL